MRSSRARDTRSFIGCSSSTCTRSTRRRRRWRCPPRPRLTRRRRRTRYFPFFSFSFCLVSSILPHINHCVTRRLLMRHLFSAILSQQRENSVSIRRCKGRQNKGANSATGLERNSEIDCALTTRLGMVRRKCLVSYQREELLAFYRTKELPASNEESSSCVNN